MQHIEETALLKFRMDSNRKPDWQGLKYTPAHTHHIQKEILIHESLFILSTMGDNCNDELLYPMALTHKQLLDKYNKNYEAVQKQQEKEATKQKSGGIKFKPHHKTTNKLLSEVLPQ